MVKNINKRRIDLIKIEPDEEKLKESILFLRLNKVFEDQDLELHQTSFKQRKKADDTYEYMVIVNDKNTNEAEASKMVLSFLRDIGFKAYLVDGRKSIKDLASRPYNILAVSDETKLHIEVRKRSQNRAKFRRLVNRRLKDAMEKIEVIGNVSDTSNYSYSDDELNEISMLLISEVLRTMKKFRNTTTLEKLNDSFNQSLQKNKKEFESFDFFIKKNDKELSLIREELRLLRQKIDKKKKISI